MGQIDNANSLTPDEKHDIILRYKNIKGMQPSQVDFMYLWELYNKKIVPNYFDKRSLHCGDCRRVVAKFWGSMIEQWNKKQ